MPIHSSNTDDPALLIQEIPWRDPAEIFTIVGDRPGTVFLDSAATGDQRARISYIGVDPIDEVRLPVASMDAVEVALRRLRRPGEAIDGPLPFNSGIIGVIGYAPGARQMAAMQARADDSEVPDLIVRRYDLILGFDLAQRRCWGIARDRGATSAASRISQLLEASGPALPISAHADWREYTSAAEHRAQVEHVLRYIAAGDIYQANVSTRFSRPRPCGFSAAAAYLALRHHNPAPFGAFVDLGEGSALISASPERFVQCDRKGRIETRPIKGTMPRDADPDRDRANADQLAASAKDIAENLMICDLLRNDLSQVAVAGSIDVPQLAALEGFASVWHLVSAVRGQLAPGRDAIDLLRATLPGGSITGAPKKRAIEIIDEVETSARGAFYGTVFWLGDDGAMDSSLIIRSIVVTPTQLIAAAGGGIVADSDPQAEYAELRAKIDPVLEAFGPKP